MIRLGMALVFLCLGFVSIAHPQQTDRRTDDRETADRCRQLLESSVIDFYLPDCVDQQQGGYLEVIDGDGNVCWRREVPDAPGPTTLVL